MIDWGRVEELQAEIGEDAFAEVVSLFLEEADEAIDRLVNEKDLVAIEGQLHFIKGSALNLGLSELAALCQFGERMAAAGSAVEVDLGQIVKAYHTSRESYLAGIKSRTAA